MTIFDFKKKMETWASQVLNYVPSIKQSSPKHKTSFILGTFESFC